MTEIYILLISSIAYLLIYPMWIIDKKAIYFPNYIRVLGAIIVIISIIYQIVYGMLDVVLGSIIEISKDQVLENIRVYLSIPTLSGLVQVCDFFTSGISFHAFFSYGLAVSSARYVSGIEQYRKKAAIDLAFLSVGMLIILKQLNLFIWNIKFDGPHSDLITIFVLFYAICICSSLGKALRNSPYLKSKHSTLLMLGGLTIFMLEPIFSNIFQVVVLYEILRCVFLKREISYPDWGSMWRVNEGSIQDFAMITLLSLAIPYAFMLTGHMTAFPPVMNLFVNPSTVYLVFHIPILLLITSMLSRSIILSATAYVFGVISIILIFLVYIPLNNTFSINLPINVSWWPFSATVTSMLILLSGLIIPSLSLFNENYASHVPDRRFIRNSLISSFAILVFSTSILFLSATVSAFYIYQHEKSSISKMLRKLDDDKQNIYELVLNKNIKDSEKIKYLNITLAKIKEKQQENRKNIVIIIFGFIVLSYILYDLSGYPAYLRQPISFILSIRRKGGRENAKKTVHILRNNEKLLVFFLTVRIFSYVVVAVSSSLSAIAIWFMYDIYLVPVEKVVATLILFIEVLTVATMN